jgi:hypothetical protein
MSNVTPEEEVFPKIKTIDDESDFEFLTNASKLKPHVQVAPQMAPPQEAEETVRVNKVDEVDEMVKASEDPNIFEFSEVDLRHKKSDLLNRFHSKNPGNKYSSKHFTMNTPTKDIEDELEYILSKRNMEKSMVAWKRGLLLFTDGVVALNSQLDPFDVDLSYWARDTHWQINKEDTYDEMLEELIIKYRGSFNLPPELKLAFAMGSSLVLSVMTQKQEKALMKKKLEERKFMEESVRQQVKHEMDRMTRAQSPIKFSGPSATESDMLCMMESESTADESDKESTHHQPIVVGTGRTAGATPKKRGRPKKRGQDNMVTLDRL